MQELHSQITRNRFQMRQKYKNCVLMKSLSENCSPEFLHYKIVLVVELMCKAYGWSWEEQTIYGRCNLVSIET